MADEAADATEATEADKANSTLLDNSITIIYLYLYDEAESNEANKAKANEADKAIVANEAADANDATEANKAEAANEADLMLLDDGIAYSLTKIFEGIFCNDIHQSAWN